MSAIWVEITATRGSAPRDAGTAMKVTVDATEGTIGGGALEHRAIARARAILQSGGPEEAQTLPLGPGLGQCCGGSVSLRYTRDALCVDAPVGQCRDLAPASDAPLPLWLWGAGHVGRAVVALSHPRAVAITWVDSDMSRFPATIPAHVTPLPAADMPRLAASAPRDAHHLIFTYAHDIDLALCGALLRRGFASCGVIGSDTKWARFSKRLRATGLDPASITCPIGDKSLGKLPADIAKGALHALTTERIAA